MSEEDLCTTANVQEVIPGAICPLSRDILVKCIEAGILDQIHGKATDDDLQRPFEKLILIHRHHVFMEVYQVAIIRYPRYYFSD